MMIPRNTESLGLFYSSRSSEDIKDKIYGKPAQDHPSLCRLYTSVHNVYSGVQHIHSPSKNLNINLNVRRNTSS